MPGFATPALTSRLPNVGTTIFSVMSALAQQHGAVNLGQGFPDFDCDPRLLDAVDAAMRAGLNQYAPMAGVAALREAVSAKILALYGGRYDPGDEVTITAGATQAILTAVLAVVHPGDEVIVLDPSYDSYDPAVQLAGGTAVHVPLGPPGPCCAQPASRGGSSDAAQPHLPETAGRFEPDFDRIAAAITPRTRAIIVNTPHNPSATVWSAAHMERLSTLLRPTDIVVIADEVYEHMVFDGVRHESVARWPELAARSFLISSFGKTYHVTGWKIGYVAAPAALMAEFRKVHQFNVFAVNTPMQHALAAFMGDASHHLGLPAFYQRKRDLFLSGLAQTRLRPLHTQGTYFQCVDYSAISEEAEDAFCRHLVAQTGVAAIPLAAFYADGREQRIVRFCFAKQDATLRLALERLARL